MAFLAEIAGAVLDGATGELLEYRHLLKNPAYREVWGVAYGKEVGRLAQGLDGFVEYWWQGYQISLGPHNFASTLAVRAWFAQIALRMQQYHRDLLGCPLSVYA